MRQNMIRNAFALICAILLLTGVFSCHALAAPADTFTILLLGTDQMEKEVKDDSELGRSDAIVIATLHLKTGAVKMVSLNRDYLVEFPNGHGADRLCAATYLGGPQLTLQTVNEVFHLDIPYFALVDFSGMQRMIDSLGGAEVEVLEDELDILSADKITKAFEKAGKQSINGSQAISYMRSRGADDDALRSVRQRKVLSACLQKGLKLKMDDMIDLAGGMLDYLKTNMSLNDIVSTAFSLVSIKISGMEDMRSPLKGMRNTVNLHSVVAAEDMQAEIDAVHAFLYGNAV